jgi:hypothetical protein
LIGLIYRSALPDVKINTGTAALNKEFVNEKLSRRTFHEVKTKGWLDNIV